MLSSTLIQETGVWEQPEHLGFSRRQPFTCWRSLLPGFGTVSVGQAASSSQNPPVCAQIVDIFRLARVENVTFMRVDQPSAGVARRAVDYLMSCDKKKEKNPVGIGDG